MKLITECLDSKLHYIVESTGSKNVYIEGIFMQADQVNKNNRIYPKGILKEGVEKFITEQIKTNRAVGELDHPEGPKINMDRISHKITELRWEGNDVYGKALVLNTPMGQIVKGLIEGGVQIGVSSRGMGSVSNRNDGVSTIQDDFHLATIDIVQDPSAPSAFVNGIMEGVEYFYDNGVLREKQVESYKTEIRSATSKRALAEAQMKVWSHFLSSLQ